MMNTLKSTVEKITQFLDKKDELSAIERDLLLGYTRDFYEQILQVNTSQNEIVLEEIQPIENETVEFVVNEMASSENIEVADETKEESIDELSEEKEDEEIESPVSEKIIFAFDDVENEPFILEPELQEKTKSEEIHLSNTASTEPFILKDEKPISPSFTEFKTWNRDIRKYIGINDKYNFISELFGNNAESYEEILNQINLKESKEEVVNFLEKDGITTLYHWHVDGQSETIFYNVVSQFFASR